MSTRVGVIYDEAYLEHDTGAHVENSERLKSTLKLIEESGLKNEVEFINPRPATIDEIAMVHSKEYITRIEQKSEKGGGKLDVDTVTSKGSYKAATLAAGAVLTAVDEVMNSRFNSAFALVRPPGHHAACWHSMGFCLFNNIAVGAKYALANYDIQRILIVDFDVHHGNGTQDTFYTDPNVLYFSTHQYPFYPGTGNMDEKGAREGTGFTVNVPLIGGWGDFEYQAVFEDVLAPVARRFQPQLIMVSAGYDAHWADSIASMQVSVSGFSRLTEIIKTLANMICGGKMVFTLEGGYNTEALALSVAATLNTLLGKEYIDDPLGKKELEIHNNFYAFLKICQDKHNLKL
jgi:acetoin utilization deacetylase AcuC-like enzyme